MTGEATAMQPANGRVAASAQAMTASLFMMDAASRASIGFLGPSQPETPGAGARLNGPGGAFGSHAMGAGGIAARAAGERLLPATDTLKLRTGVWVAVIDLGESKACWTGSLGLARSWRHARTAA